MRIAVQHASGTVLAEPSMDWLGSYGHCGTVGMHQAQGWENQGILMESG